MTRTLGQQAIRLCEFLSCAEYKSVLVDQTVLRAEFSVDAGQLAETSYESALLDPACTGFDWRELWAEAAQRLREGSSGR